MEKSGNTLIEIDASAYGEVLPIETGDVETVVEELRRADRSRLLDRNWLETRLLPRLGLNDEWSEHFPSCLRPFLGKGVKSWQYPCQFSGYLLYLANKNVTNYLEIGVRHGGTFIITCEYLNRFADLGRMVAIDPLESPVVNAYRALQPRVLYITELSHAAGARQIIQSCDWDHVLIDGDHSFEGCRTDFDLVKDRARRVALHDIVSFTTPGVVSMWRTIRSVTPSRRLFEQTQQYSEVVQKTHQPIMGIGVVEMA